MAFQVYRGEDYLDFNELEAWCRQAATHCPRWVSLSSAATSRHGRPILLLTIGDQQKIPDDQPTFWIDGGTHAAEWAGVMAVIYAVSSWIERLLVNDPELVAWFSRNSVVALPCLSPDGYQAMHDGAPFVRSSLRPNVEGFVRSGLDPRDMDGDGFVRWMRWRDPAGPFVADETCPWFLRPRRIGDDPEQAYFACDEGLFLNWDGIRTVSAPLKFGLDLNRNFPGHWAPFSMFGMDGGAYPLSEEESRATVAAFAARRHVACVLSNHTYTGAILTQPYRQDTPLSDMDIRLMELLAQDAVDGTTYRVIRTYPDFVYDPKKAIVGVWADTAVVVFGVCAYTLELWDPFGYAGLTVEKPAEFFHRPDPEIVRKMLVRFAEDPNAVVPWTPFDHPQLGPVELGGIDYLRTVRNPPVSLLATECARGLKVADTLRRSLPSVVPHLVCQPLGNQVSQVTFVLENQGFLPTSGLLRGESIQACPPVSVRLQTTPPMTLHQGTSEVGLPHLDGWGSARVDGASHPLYPDLQSRGNKAVAQWIVSGSGTILCHWQAGRGGVGTASVTVHDQWVESTALGEPMEAEIVEDEMV